MNRRSTDRRYIKEAQRERHQARREEIQAKRDEEQAQREIKQGREQEKREKTNLVQQEKDRLKGVLDQSSMRNRTLLIVFVTFMVYLTVTVLSTTDLDLFLPESKIDLPLIQLKIPLVTFFWVAPILLLVLHFNLLFNLYLHADKLKAWKQYRDSNPNNHLLPFIFNFLEALPSVIIKPLLRFFIWSIAYAWPLVNLLLIQIRFSAYQHEIMTPFHMGAVALDLIFLGAFWFRLKPSKKTPTENSEAQRSAKGATIKKWRSEIIVSILVLCIAGVNGAAWYHVRQGEELVSSSMFSPWWNPLIKPHLDLSNQTLLKEKPPVAVVEPFRKEMSEKAKDKKTDPKIDAWMAHAEGLILKNRHFNFGNFRSSVLLKANFQNSSLQGADLRGAQLQGADIREAQLQGTDFSYAQLQEADLREAQLQEADLREAQLQGADLRKAQLQGASLIQAQLHGGDLERAQLQGADLRKAQLQGASLSGAQLQGADLISVQLQGASLRKAQLQGANLNFAQLQEADLRKAQLQGASLERAQLQGADLREAQLQGADLRKAQLQRASLIQAQLQGAYFSYAQLQGADLREAQLQGAYSEEAQLQGADLERAQLQGADLISVQLQGAYLRSAQLQGAYLKSTQLQGADLRYAQLQGADLRYAQLQGAHLRKAQLQGAHLRKAQLYGTQWEDSGMVPLWLEEPLNLAPYKEWHKLLQMSVPKRPFTFGGIFSGNIKAGMKRTNDEEGLERLREAHDPEAVKALWKNMACDENEYVQKAMRERLNAYEIDWSCSNVEKEP